jgi:putative aldouronate transport system permease protein
MELAVDKKTGAETKLRIGKLRRIWRFKMLYALLLPALAWVFVFDYVPLYYLPRFVSWVVYGGIITILLSPETGIVNKIVELFGGTPAYLLVEPAYFRTILVVTDAMKEMGWAAILYIAAIAGLNPEVYEAAIVDGATRFKRIIHVTLPGIAGTIVVIFILRVGYVMSAGLDQVINLYNPMVFEVGDILDTYIYRVGIEQFNLSLAAAADVIKGVNGLLLVLAANRIVKRIDPDSGIF